MGFRDLVDGIRTVKDPVSVNYDMKITSESSGNEPLLFSEIIESPGKEQSRTYLLGIGSVRHSMLSLEN